MEPLLLNMVAFCVPFLGVGGGFSLLTGLGGTIRGPCSLEPHRQYGRNKGFWGGDYRLNQKNPKDALKAVPKKWDEESTNGFPSQAGIGRGI